MKTKLISALCVLPVWALAAFTSAEIETATGLKGGLIAEEGVFKVTAPRSDVKVAVDAWPMPPFMGLTSWAAFKSGKQAESMVMGDLVLFQDEVNPVMSVALDTGLKVTALHNHFFYDDPHVFFMHISGEGTVEKLGGAVKAALAKVKEIRAAHPSPAKSFGAGFAPAGSAIPVARLEAIMGAKAAAKDGMAKFVFGRQVRMPCGCEAGKEMGVNTWAAFAGTDDDAIVDGDFAVHEDELQAVLKSLRGDGVNIVAIHHHMSGEEPRMLFLHYWGRGKAAELAQSVKTALGLTDKPEKASASK